MTFVRVAEANEIPIGEMKHVEVEGTEILLANVGGKFFAVGDRCTHLSSLLSNGSLNNTIVTCPRHFASFDVTTGKAISGPSQRLPTYEVKVEGENVFVNL